MKKLLLTLVPALMLLGSCSGAQPQVENKLFQETTVAQEEVAKKAHKNEITPAVTPKAPKVGVRVKDHGNGKHSIRFIAAITADDLNTIKASWTRTMYLSTGGIQKETRSNIACTYAYTQLVDETGEGFINISDAGFEGYNCFVVYTMTNVPDDYLGSYLNAQLTIDSKNDTFDFVTDIVSSTIDQSKHASFPANKYGYFLSGLFSGVQNVKESDNNTVSPGENYATFSTLNLQAGDSFVLVHRDEEANTFVIYGNDTLGGTESLAFFDKVNGRMQTNFAGTYNLSLKKEDSKLYSEVDTSNLTDGYYLVGDFTAWKFFAINKLGAGEGDNKAQSLRMAIRKAGNVFVRYCYDHGKYGDTFGPKGKNQSYDNWGINEDALYDVYVNGEYKLWINFAQPYHIEVYNGPEQVEGSEIYIMLTNNGEALPTLENSVPLTSFEKPDNYNNYKLDVTGYDYIFVSCAKESTIKAWKKVTISDLKVGSHGFTVTSGVSSPDVYWVGISIWGA